MQVVWTAYLKYRVQIRGFDLAKIEHIVRHSEERYFDSATYRRVAVGSHGHLLVIIPYDQEEEILTPVTIHSTTRQQINLRVRTGRFKA